MVSVIIIMNRCYIRQCPSFFGFELYSEYKHLCCFLCLSLMLLSMLMLKMKFICVLGHLQESCFLFSFLIPFYREPSQWWNNLLLKWATKELSFLRELPRSRISSSNMLMISDSKPSRIDSVKSMSTCWTNLTWLLFRTRLSKKWWNLLLKKHSSMFCMRCIRNKKTYRIMLKQCFKWCRMSSSWSNR